jgi:hypothetical protein
MESALKGLLTDDAAACNTAVTWAKTADFRLTGVSCDNCRWFGEQVITIYDWCYNQMSQADRTALETKTDTWTDHWRKEVWGGVPMHQNNYYWGNVRNETEWALARYGSNTAIAQTLFTDVFTTRLQNDFYPSAQSGTSVGGVGQEGGQYGPYVLGYSTIPLLSAKSLGRNMFSDSNYWLSAVYATIYGTTPGVSGTSYDLFTWNDNDGSAPSSASDSNLGNYMTAAAMNWSSTPAGGHARKWVTQTGAERDFHIQAVDTGTPAAQEYTGLPLDYYASGPEYLYGRNSWSTNATAYLLQLGDLNGVGHSHDDLGTFQIWRGGKWLSRESVGYCCSNVNVLGIGGAGSADIGTAPAHNGLVAYGKLPGQSGRPVVTRLESQPDYSFTTVNLTPAYSGAGAMRVEREFLFIRPLETMVVLDRLSGGSSGAKNTFLAHCETSPTIEDASHATCTNGTQALRLTSLLGSPTIRSITEGGSSGQFRIEIETTGGGTQDYMLTVMQAKDATASNINPTVVDNGTSFVLSLNANTTVVFAKGSTSTGGSITLNGSTRALRSGVQPMSVTTSGPVWGQ